MGANQSIKSRQQFAPGFSPVANNATNKNSFSKQQLNRLLRKSLPTQSRLDRGGQHANFGSSGSSNRNNANNQCKLNGNSKSDELARVSSGQLELQGNKSIYGHESTTRASAHSRLLNNNDEGGSNKFNNCSNKKYFVTGDGGDQAQTTQRQERLGSTNQGDQDEDNVLSNRTTAAAAPSLSYDAYREQANSRHTAHISPYESHQANRQLELHEQQRLLLVRQQHRQQQHNTTEQHHNKSIMTMTMTAPSNQQARQPLNSSNDQHRQLQHQNQHHQQEQQQQQLQQLHLSDASIRPSKNSKPLQPMQVQQPKSSCSPSSAGSCSSPTSSAGSSAASSRESLKLHRRLNTPAVNSAQGSLQAGASAKLNSSNDCKNLISPEQQQLVAMQHHHNGHRRSHSSGEPLSWSKQQQQQQMAAINLRNNNDHQQRLLLASQLQQASRGHQQQPLRANLTLDSRHMLSPDLYHQQHPMNYTIAGRNADEIEQFYSRNLHLLATGDPEEAYQQHSSPNSINNKLQLYSSNTLGHMSAPLQRRYKWPKQQYQYLNTNAASEGFQNHPHHNQRQQLLHLSVPTHPSSQQTLQSTITSYGDELGSFALITTNPNHQSIADYYDQDLNVLYPFSPSVAHLHVSSTLKSRSKSPANIKSKPRSRNPLAGIFGPATPSVSSEKDTSKFGANTIHHLSSSKSHQNLQSSMSRSASQSNGNANSSSLKRIKSSPLTAQQTSYEAMRTIDMYLIRQIARSCMDFEMEQKIDLEIRLRELAAQSMLEAKNEIDVLEVEKSLLTSDQRMNCYASQLEQQRKRLSNPSLSTTDSGRGSKASRWDSLTATNKKGTQTRRSRSDVIGASNGSSQQHEGGSPNLSLLSKSPQSSPSKLSPVSGQSANSGLTSQQSPAPTSTTGTISSSLADVIESKTEQNRSSLSRSNHHVIRRPTSASNTLSRRHKSQRQKHREHLAHLIASQYNIDWNLAPDTKATLTLSELRVPLMWRDVDHFKGRGDYRRYAVFCLAKIGSQIYDTQLISDVDRQMTDLTFDDMIMFNNVGLDFELELEVYSCIYLEQFSLSSTPRKLMEKLSNSVGRAMGRRLATQTASVNYIKELEAYDKSYRFAMIANAKLTLADASESIKTYDLQLMSPEAHGRHSTASQIQHQGNGVANESINGSNLTQNRTQAMMNRYYKPCNNHNGIVTASNQRDLHKNTLPLFGHFCCRLHVRPNVFDDKHASSGYL